MVKVSRQALVALASVIAAVTFAGTPLVDSHGHGYEVRISSDAGGAFDVMVASTKPIPGGEAEEREFSGLWRKFARRICGGAFEGESGSYNDVVHSDTQGSGGELIGHNTTSFGGVSGRVTCRHGA